MSSDFMTEVIRLGMKNIWTFFKAQVKSTFVNFFVLMLGFMLTGYDWIGSLGLSLGMTLLEFVPIVGAGVGFIPWIIGLWLVKDTATAWSLLVLYLVSQLLKQLIEPYFLGKDLSLPFWMPAVVTFLCTLVFNLFGIVIAAILIPFVSAYRTVQQAHNQAKDSYIN